MAMSATALGAWLARRQPLLPELLFLALAAGAATAFGNVINDVRDIDGDRVNHPNRPLVRGLLSPATAVRYALLLAAAALACAWAVSTLHVAAAAVPLALLLAYALALKGIPLTGNMLVATLVAYPVLFGALGSGHIERLLIPAALAFLLNLSREIVKDIQDATGDRATGIRTSAALPSFVLSALLVVCSATYLVLLFMPAVLEHFGLPYTVVCAAAVLPLHFGRTLLFFGSDAHGRYRKTSTLLKIEMATGLVALAADEIVRSGGG